MQTLPSNDDNPFLVGNDPVDKGSGNNLTNGF